MLGVVSNRRNQLGSSVENQDVQLPVPVQRLIDHGSISFSRPDVGKQAAVSAKVYRYNAGAFASEGRAEGATQAAGCSRYYRDPTFETHCSSVRMLGLLDKGA